MIVVLPAVILSSLILFVYSLLTGERVLFRSTHATVSTPYGAQLALSRLYSGRSLSRLPAIWIVPDPVPSARVIRRLGSQGALLISQGLIATFQDDEIEEVLRQSAALLSKRGIVWRSACSGWLIRLKRLRRPPWTPLRALVWWYFLPLEKFLVKRHDALNILRNESIGAPSLSSAQSSALHKVSRFERIFS